MLRVARLSGITEPFSHWTLHGTRGEHVEAGATVPWKGGVVVSKAGNARAITLPCFEPGKLT